MYNLHKEELIYTSQNSIELNPKATIGFPSQGSIPIQERGVFI